MAKMIDIQDQHHGELKVYRREEADRTISDFWYYQINIPNHQRIRHKSAKERELASALMAANVQYQKFKQRAMMGLSIASVSLEQVYKDAREYYERRHQAGLLDKTRFHRFQIMALKKSTNQSKQRTLPSKVCWKSWIWELTLPGDKGRFIRSVIRSFHTYWLMV
jgi:hypothetical protein